MEVNGTSLFQKFGYNLPESFGDVTDICEKAFICGIDKKWHKKDSYDGDMGRECDNKDTLIQVCNTYKTGNTSCVSEGDVTYCYEKVENIPNNMSSTAQITTVPEPGKGNYICGFDINDDTHVTVLATNCDACPYDLSSYEGQQCSIKNKQDKKQEKESEETQETQPETVEESKEDSKESLFTCHFTKDSYATETVVEKSCLKNRDCPMDNQSIVEKWVDGITIKMNTDNFTMKDVLDKVLPLNSDLRNKCILGTDKCDQRFSSIEDAKKYLKENLAPKRFVKNLKKDRTYGSHVYRSISDSNSVCGDDNKCMNNKIVLKDFVYIKPNVENTIEIKKVDNTVSSLFVNGKKVSDGLESKKGIVHCSEEKTCENYTDNIDSIIDLNNATKINISGDETVFKIIKDEDIFIMDNEYTVKTNPENAKEECSKLLCSVNQLNCPSNFCTIDGMGNCTPTNKDVFVTSIE
tara:strand:+ start:796 stop:2190 length:1395 start_codon:yes stop_codon:yes gene_type:complete